MSKNEQISPDRLSSLIKAAYSEANRGSKLKDGGPFGAVLIINDKVIAKAHNTVLRDNDPTCHAEVNAIRKACKKLKVPHLENAILIASSEPCPMCLTTSYWAHIKTIYYSLPKTVAAKYGFIDDFIYKDLAKPTSKRLLVIKQTKKHLNEGVTIFKEWQKTGKIY